MTMAANTSNATNDCYPLFSSDSKCDIILGFRRAVGIVSILCCLFVVFIIILFKKYKFLPQRLILYLSLAALFQAVGYTMTDYHIASEDRHGHWEGICIFQSYWTLFFDWVSFLWVCCITFNIFWNAVFSRKTDKFEKYYFVIDIGVPLIISCFPFIQHTYGPAGLWCWISSVRNGNPYYPGIAMQFTVFYGPFWILCIVLMCILTTAYCYIRRNIRRYEGQYNPLYAVQKKLWEEEIRPLMLFPWIYIIILIFPSINRIRYACGYDAPDTAANFFFWFMHSVTLTLHGTVYALVFGCDKRTLSRLKWNELKSAAVTWRQSRVQDYPIGESSADEYLKELDPESIGNEEYNDYPDANYIRVDDKN